MGDADTDEIISHLGDFKVEDDARFKTSAEGAGAPISVERTVRDGTAGGIISNRVDAPAGSKLRSEVERVRARGIEEELTVGPRADPGLGGNPARDPSKFSAKFGDFEFFVDGPARYVLAIALLVAVVAAIYTVTASS